MSFRYYLYISDSKVDQLLSQIDPAFTGERSVEINVNLPGLGGKRTTGSSVGTDRIARLERVVRYLHDHGDLGSVDEPGQFFWGMLPMRWAFLPSRPDLVFFAGRTNGTVLGLGGSARHVLGAPPEAGGAGIPLSVPPALLQELAVASELEDEHLLDAVDDAFDDELGGGFDGEDLRALGIVCRAVDRTRGPAQNVEFVAKRLLHGPSPLARADASVLLGSPVYVALVD